MAIFLKRLIIGACFLFSLSIQGHTIYAPNDIPLLDNRFRIDPNTEHITFIFSHSKGHQRVVLVQPDGSKLYQDRHPSNVAWTSSETENIVTIEDPMAGPWQAIANLDGDNRIRILSQIHLKTSKLPLKLYQGEYITTTATLYEGAKLLKDPAYLNDAKLSISLISNADEKMALYKDDGKQYDQLAFDGQLTARFHVDLMPGRYLLSVRTENEVFMRNVNNDAVVFPVPITYKAVPLSAGSDQAKLTFNIDNEELDVNSISIQGVIKDASGNTVQEVVMHNSAKERKFSNVYQLAHKMYHFAGKAYATTTTGREIEFQLTNKSFELASSFIMPNDIKGEQFSPTETTVTAQDSDFSLTHLWIIIAITLILLIIIALITVFMLKQTKEKGLSDDESLEELNFEQLNTTQNELKDAK